MSSPRCALITGITGQDGSYLAELLLDRGYDVAGVVRRSSTVNFERIAHIQDRLTLVPGDLLDQGSLVSIIAEHRPTEVYNLAAQSFVMTSFSQPVLTGDVTALGAVRLLESIARSIPTYASTRRARRRCSARWPRCRRTSARPSIPARPMASPRSTPTGSRSTTARATTCSPRRGSCSTTAPPAAGSSSWNAR